MFQLNRSQMVLLRQYGIRPVKRRGQNFLIDGNLARWIAAAVAELGRDVLELGAGAGALTTHLLAAGARVTAVEVDRRLCGLLRQEWGEKSAFRLIEADLGRVEWPELLAEAGPRPVVAGNLPYVLTSTVLFALADCRDSLVAAVLMVQKEVAERLTAMSGEREYGVLSAVLGSLFAIDVIRKVPADVFWPRPDVASAVVRLVPLGAWPETEFRYYKEVVKILFGQRRKKMSTLLRKHFQETPDSMAELAQKTSIDFEKRPEQLSPEQLRTLARALAARREL